MLRTHTAGSLRAADVTTPPTAVTLTGWVASRRDHGGVEFIDLRDASGIVQVVARDEVLSGAAHGLRNEFCVRVTGEVTRRGAENVNPDLPTGEIEVVAREIEVLSEAAPLPFQIDERTTVGEEARLQATATSTCGGPARTTPARDPTALQGQPGRPAGPRRARLRRDRDADPDTLDPEGARDFLVPARLSPGSWYALPQSPQLFKQLLMVAGMERYYQIARCYRDEDFRADRQPEFTQLDIEMSFVTEDDVIALGEALVVREIWQLIGYELDDAVPADDLRRGDGALRIRQARPAVRLELVDCTDYFPAPVPGVPGRLRGRRRDARRRKPAARTFDAGRSGPSSAGRRAWPTSLVGDDGELAGPGGQEPLRRRARRRSPGTPAPSPATASSSPPGPQRPSRALLGAARLEIGKRCDLIDESAWASCGSSTRRCSSPGDDVAAGDVAVGAGAWTAVHHAFTSPKPSSSTPSTPTRGPALAYAYDIVCNGNEIGGGSIRIHRRDVQERVFKVMGITQEEAQEKFGFLLDAFAFGAPPHGGIAFGWDRIARCSAGTTRSATSSPSPSPAADSTR
jgi:aspartyl-tRNA synthetase